jgi:hypothetical protein
MELEDLCSLYTTDLKAKTAFKAFRDEQGVICKKCTNTTHYWKQDKWQYECKACRFRTTLRSGTIIEGSKLPFRYWMISMACISATKKSFSATELQRRLDHKRYEPIWSMLHKIRADLERSDDSKYELEGGIKIHKVFFLSPTVKADKPILQTDQRATSTYDGHFNPSTDQNHT